MVILTLVHAVTYNSRSLHVDATPKVEAYFKINGVYEVVSVGGGAGPQIAQDVLYNLGGVIVPAKIWSVIAVSVNLVYFNAAGATSVSGVIFNPNLAQRTWCYPQFV